MLEHTPRFDAAVAERTAAHEFGLAGRATPLTSERDQNFLIDGGGRAVLKIANALEERSFLEAQQAVLAHLSADGDAAPLGPRVLRARSGATLSSVVADDGTAHLAWAITWIDGEPLASSRRRSPELLEDFGRVVARLNRALATFDHPAIHRDFYWDLARARSIVASQLELVASPDLRAAIDRLMGAFDQFTQPLLDRLPRSAIHGDLNDHNVLVTTSGSIETREQRITGIVDFGDLVHSYRIGELAIAMAYMMLDTPDPLAAAAAMMRGYASIAQPTDDEVSSVFGLAVLRLCASVCIAAEQTRARPDNEYLNVSQRAIADVLPRLADVPFGLADATLRVAAGRSASAKANRVVAYLSAQKEFAPVLGIDLRREPSIVLDLSISSPMLHGDTRLNDEPHLTESVFALMRAANVRVSIGRYDEPRLLYVAPAFAGDGRPTDEHRTIHIGLDLFAEAGTPVLAPLHGVVHAMIDNNRPQDYGPVIILRHTTSDGDEFFTLYGHLSRESLSRVRIGESVDAGHQIATLGTADVNGGWTPHLHLQIITDLLGLGTEFPGVAYPSRRAAFVGLCPDPTLLVGVPPDRFPAVPPTKSETLRARRESIGGNLSVAFRDPVKIVRGFMQYLYDDEGHTFLDAYNNVPHVGHCHPRVVEAASAQMRVLNTNTRYLNDLLETYAARLLETLPSPLEVCYFLNSASEANELALRLARACTGRRDTIVLEAAYHGNTTSLIDISPYKHAGPGGKGAPDWVHVAPLPDDYRGPYKRGEPDVGERYAADVADVVEGMRRRGRGVGAFIAETCPSVGGQLLLPAGYLRHVYAHVRSAGGICIADEVQTGLGRMGTSFWAFEDQGVIPDIVVMGKPLGNGHPIAAVATTRAIADAFDNGMEFFSTFGGNTVSCAVGIAVLDVLRDEQLQDHARRIGDRMLSAIGSFAHEFPIIGDVRGSGLFLGVELVRNRETLEPAGEEASFVANRMRERGILLGTDGPYHNVVKIRPPMPFGASDADLLAEELRAALRQLPD